MKFILRECEGCGTQEPTHHKLKARKPELLMNGEQQIKVGCCGFAAAQKKYFERFRVVEIQQTFYQIPEIKTAEKWRHAAPPGFEFTMKAWQLIIHLPSRNESLAVDTDYFRLHGITNYVHSYTDTELEILRNKIRKKRTYVMFNNKTMKEDALRFMKILNAESRRDGPGGSSSPQTDEV
jgi:uncharacterized protein YecE (DUF72 family)